MSECARRVWRYQRGNHNSYIEEEQTTQWQKKVQKDKQRSTKHAYKTKDRVTRTPLKTGCELRCSGGVSSSCSTIGTRGVNLVSNPVISREWGKDREVFTTIGTYPWSFRAPALDRRTQFENVIHYITEEYEKKNLAIFFPKNGLFIQLLCSVLFIYI